MVAIRSAVSVWTWLFVCTKKRSFEAGGRYTQCTFCVNLTVRVHQKAVFWSRWPLFAVHFLCELDCSCAPKSGLLKQWPLYAVHFLCELDCSCAPKSGLLKQVAAIRSALSVWTWLFVCTKKRSFEAGGRYSSTAFVLECLSHVEFVPICLSHVQC